LLDFILHLTSVINSAFIHLHIHLFVHLLDFKVGLTGNQRRRSVR